MRETMTGKFFRSLYVGRMTEYLFLVAIVSGKLKLQGKLSCCSMRTRGTFEGQITRQGSRIKSGLATAAATVAVRVKVHANQTSLNHCSMVVHFDSLRYFLTCCICI